MWGWVGVGRSPTKHKSNYAMSFTSGEAKPITDILGHGGQLSKTKGAMAIDQIQMEIYQIGFTLKKYNKPYWFFSPQGGGGGGGRLWFKGLIIATPFI